MVALLKQIERNSAAGDFDACRTSLNNLNSEFRKFSSEAATF
jgi:hypothetical protein